MTLSESKRIRKKNNHEPRGCQPAESKAEQRAKQRKQQAATTAHRAQSKQRNDDPGKRLAKKPKPGGHSLMAPPGPIPNPEVKHQHVDGSRTTGPARVDSRQGSNEAPEPKGSGASSVSGGWHPGHGESQRGLASRPYSRRLEGRDLSPALRDGDYPQNRLAVRAAGTTK